MGVAYQLSILSITVAVKSVFHHSNVINYTMIKQLHTGAYLLGVKNCTKI